jgi:TRAP-type C4-dicarboxylate transport system substrate-binding protein
MAWGEVFTAMQQGVIDGQENPIAVYYATKLWDAKQKYLSLTAHVYSPAPILMSKKVFDAMPAEDQALFSQTALEVAKFQRKINRDAEESRLQEVAGKGTVVVRDVDRESFRQAMMPIFDQFSGQFPKADIDAIMNAR